MVSLAPRAAPLADKCPLSTESCVKARLGALKLQIRAEKAPVLGGVMPAKRTSKANLKSIMGSALLAGGSIVMVAYLRLIGSQFGISLNDSLTGWPFSSLSLGLASLHVLQSLTFDRGLFFSGAYKILILFSGFAVTATGLALLRSHAVKGSSQE